MLCENILMIFLSKWCDIIYIFNKTNLLYINKLHIKKHMAKNYNYKFILIEKIKHLFITYDIKYV